MRRKPAALEQPDLPVHPEPLQLSVAAHPDASARGDRLGDVLRMLPHRVLLLEREARRPGGVARAAAADLRVEILRMREVPQLGVAREILRLVEPSLAERSAIFDNESRRVRDLRALVPLEDVFVFRRDRQRVLDAGVAVEAVRDVELEVEAALGGRHETEFLRRHDDPLALLAVAGHVHLERLRVVVLRILLEDRAGVIEILHILGDEDARAGGVAARADHFTRLHAIVVREEVGGGRLRIARGGGAVGELRQILPHLVGVDRRNEPLRVVVCVDETGHDRLPADVDDLRVGRHLHRAARADGDDAIVLHEHVGVLDDLLTLHGDRATAAKHHRAARSVAQRVDDDPLFHRLVARLVLRAVGLGGRVGACGCDGRGGRQARGGGRCDAVALGRGLGSRIRLE